MLNGRKIAGNGFGPKLAELRSRLLSAPVDDLTLCRVAREVAEVFDVDYCSIHVLSADSPWQNLSGVATKMRDCLPELAEHRKDHFAGTLELVAEQELGVRNFPVRIGGRKRAVFVVKSDELSDGEAQEIAELVGRHLFEQLVDSVN